jgi:imidazoleglycerol-phosphate dehydratase
MLIFKIVQQISSHSLLDITVNATGDTWIDDHHTVEDIALAFGGALSEALGERRGIVRFGDFCAPLDEALVHVVLVRKPH